MKLKNEQNKNKSGHFVKSTLYMYFGHLRKVIDYVELIIQQKLLLIDSTIRNIIIIAHDHETNKCHDEPNTIEIKKNMKHVTN
jgi:hypothetical protein